MGRPGPWRVSVNPDLATRVPAPDRCQFPGRARSVKTIFDDEIITRNPAHVIKLTNRRTLKRRKRHAWTVDDARWFPGSTWHAGEALYAALVLILVLPKARY